jgi:hypothetical protein
MASFGRCVMDWSWLPPATFGVAVTLVVTWVQDCLLERRRKSGEKRARIEDRFGEVRSFLLGVGELADGISRVREWDEWQAKGAEGARAREQWLKKLEKRRQEVYASPLVVAPGLFVQDEVLIGKLCTIQDLTEELFKRAVAQVQGGPADDVSKLKAALNERIGEAQQLMDRIVQEL